MPVREEATAVPMLAAHGIGVARGKPFRLKPHGQEFVRVTTSALEGDRQEILDRLSEASFGETTLTAELNGGIR
jgi:hypothetical protein